MPELPEVEVVRQGLARWVTNKTINQVEVLHPRAIRNHHSGAKDFAKQLTGQKIKAVKRRGKYMWLELNSGLAVVTHLGMSGQVLIQKSGDQPLKHARIKFTFKDFKKEMHFVDQRTFGGMHIDELVSVHESKDIDEFIPTSVAHIARDPFDPNFEPESFISGIRQKNTDVKRALLDQTLMSGVGNIYADESLWRTKLHWAYPTKRLSRAKATELLGHVTQVMREALAQGGTSFDALYVNVNGESGYFSRGLAAYGREDEPCDRCGRLLVRDAFMNRSSFRCPKCQPKPKI
jgi:formamidopyrimidine-DNA glycosylase